MQTMQHYHALATPVRSIFNILVSLSSISSYREYTDKIVPLWWLCLFNKAVQEFSRSVDVYFHASHYRRSKIFRLKQHVVGVDICC